MWYKTIYNKKNRLRLRSGRYAFTEREGYCIAELLIEKKYVETVTTSHINGSIFIYLKCKDKDLLSNKNRIFKFISNLKEKDIFEVENTNDENSLKQLENEFFLKLSNILIGRVLFDIFVPIPLKKVNAVYRSIPFIIAGLKSINKWKINVAVLDALAIGGSICMKSYESAGSIVFLLSVSDILEEYTMKRTKSTLQNSLAINIDTVWMVTESGEEVAIPLQEVKEGDLVKVRSGGMIPVDGLIFSGDAMINESSMTGEHLPVHKDKGTAVHAGTVVEEGSIVIYVTCVDEQTRINKIIRLIEESEALKADIQSKAENLADSIVPLSLIATTITYILTKNPMRALSVLLVDYSCAIKLSTPISVISAMEEASKNKIMIKGGKFIENYAEADTIVFDKTGTLTKSIPKLAKIISLGKYSNEDILKISACLEEHYAHSVARAIVNEAEVCNLKHKEEHAEVEYIVAHGISTMFRSQKTMIGSAHFIFEDEKIPLNNKNKKIIDENTGQYSTIFLAIDGKLEGILCIEDPVRGEAKEVIKKLKDLGIKNVIMLTGDSENVASAVSKELGITQYKAQVLPEDKARIIEDIKKDGVKVIMVGDGINDSPALSVADVSVAMKDSSDIAREVADITLISDDLNNLVKLRILSERMLNKIQNSFKAIVTINTSLIGLGALGIVAPSNSSLIHNLSTIIIGASCTRHVLDEDKTWMI
ncbi:MAG: heavy metal translocating P-type ATPase [Methanobrevibacter sp.]|jgi:heavy metal translocating P-type ATPase|nr:heavy metal translocating P-type ATPase [Candidatus Methanovirga procula]